MEFGRLGFHRSMWVLPSVATVLTILQLHHAFNNAPEFPDFLELVAPNVNLPGPPPIIHACFKKAFGSL